MKKGEWQGLLQTGGVTEKVLSINETSSLQMAFEPRIFDEWQNIKYEGIELQQIFDQVYQFNDVNEEEVNGVVRE